MKKIIITILSLFFLLFIGINFIESAPPILSIIQGGTATSTAQVNGVWFQNSNNTSFTQNSNFIYNGNRLTVPNASTTNATISNTLNSSTDRLPNAYFTNLDSTTATIGTLTISSFANGPLIVGTTTISAPDIYWQYDTNTGFGWLADDKQALYTGGTARLIVDNQGNVGIGTTGPTQKLDVNGTIKGNIIQYGSTSENLQVVAGHSYWDSYYPLDVRVTGLASSDLTLSTTGGDIVMSGGNVGIGTTGPNDKLDVRSLVTKTNTSDNNIAFFGSLASDSNPLGLAISHSNSGSRLHMRLIGTQYGLSGNDIDINDAMTVQYTGNVGIGTTTPQSLLHIAGGTSATTTIEFAPRSTSAKTCFNVRDALGAATSFYFVGTQMIVENSYCK